VSWECDMSKDAAAYNIEPVEKSARGTDVTLHLRADEDELLDEFRLRSIIHKYSDHIGIPIFVGEEKANQASALWTRPKNEITDEQYIEFYKHVGHDFDDPLAWVHARVDYRDTTGGHEPPGTGSNGARRFPPDDRRLPRPHRGDAGCHGGARLPTRAACDWPSAFRHGGRALACRVTTRHRW